MNNNRHKDKDYYNKYNKTRSNTIILCDCGKQVKLSCKYMHTKSNVHALNLRIKKLENEIEIKRVS